MRKPDYTVPFSDVPEEKFVPRPKTKNPFMVLPSERVGGETNPMFRRLRPEEYMQDRYFDRTFTKDLLERMDRLTPNGRKQVFGLFRMQPVDRFSGSHLLGLSMSPQRACRLERILHHCIMSEKPPSRRRK